MKKILFAVITVTLMLGLFGCGSSGPPPDITTQI